MELSIEEKAKRYDEALKVLYKYDGANIMFSQSLKEEMFPELKESEDERIRKALIEHFRWNTKQILNEFSNKKALAWLEKQCERKSLDNMAKEVIKDKDAAISFLKSTGIMNENGELADEYKIEQSEQKSADKVEPKFHEGDWIINNDKRIAVPEQILKVEKYGYFTSMGYTSFDKVKTDYHLWTIQDAKDGDVLTVDNVIFIYERTLAKHIVSYCKLINDIFEPSVDARTCCEGNTYVHPATKEQRDLLFQKMHEAGYEWDAEKKELKKIEQKPADKVEPKIIKHKKENKL